MDVRLGPQTSTALKPSLCLSQILFYSPTPFTGPPPSLTLLGSTSGSPIAPPTHAITLASRLSAPFDRDGETLSFYFSWPLSTCCKGVGCLFSPTSSFALTQWVGWSPVCYLRSSLPRCPFFYVPHKFVYQRQFQNWRGRLPWKILYIDQYYPDRHPVSFACLRTYRLCVFRSFVGWYGPLQSQSLRDHQIWSLPRTDQIFDGNNTFFSSFHLNGTSALKPLCLNVSPAGWERTRGTPYWLCTSPAILNLTTPSANITTK